LALAPANAPDYLEKLREEVREDARAMIRAEVQSALRPSETWDARLSAIAERVASLQGRALDNQARLELVQYETAAAYLETAGGAALGQPLAALHRDFARLYAADDPTRAKFYLDRALRLVPAESPLASSIRYDLACWFTVVRDFEHALRELRTAFQHQSKALDDRLAEDLEEGGRLYPLANTPPFDKAVNDLLLNMSIGTN